VLRFGGEKVLTKHVTDEALPKLHVPLEEADKLVEASLRLLDDQDTGICSVHNIDSNINSLRKATAENPLLKTHATKAKVNNIKNRLEKTMHKLYDLEPDNAPEKPLNIDLDIDLYQMEKY
jgi:hypothetical protein